MIAYRSLVWIALAASAVAGQCQAADTPFLFRVNTYEVNLVFSAADFEGHPIDDLTLADIKLTDSGKVQQRVTKFEHHASLPLRVGIVVDTSRSMLGEAMRRNHAIATLFAAKVLRNGTDEAFVTGFDFDRKLLTDWTSDPDLLHDAMTRLGKDAASRLGGTAIYDSLYRTVHEQFGLQLEKTAGKANAVLLFSDGDDNVSHAYLQDVVNLCQTTQTRIYVFSDQAKSHFDHGEKNLRELAARTGGQIFYEERPAKALADLRAIEASLRDSYFLAYQPSNVKEDGKFHPISLKSPTRGGLITTRSGYYAPVRQ